jgi:hypothetical protein
MPRLVLRLSHEARQAMLEAMMLADGDKRGTFGKKRKSGVMDAWQLLAVLEGFSLGKPHNYGVIPVQRLKKCRTLYVSELKTTECEQVPVWCPTTAFGTWVMRQNGQPTITGNTGAIGRALGALGFGTQFCGDDFDEGAYDNGKLADAPVARPGLAGAAEDLGLRREQQAQSTAGLMNRPGGGGQQQLSEAQKRFLAKLKDDVKNLINEKDTDYLELNEWCKEKFGSLYEGSNLSIDQMKLLVGWLNGLPPKD